MSRAQAWSHFPINVSEDVNNWDEDVHNVISSLKGKKAFLESKWEYRALVDAYEVIATLTSIERETTTQGWANSLTNFQKNDSLSEKRKMVQFWLNALKERDVSFDEFVQKVGADTLNYSIKRFQRLAYNDSEILKTNMKISWISTKQICFQPWYDQENYRPIKDQGDFFVVEFEHDPIQLEGIQIACMSVDFHGRPSSLARFMEGGARIRDGYNDELCLGQNHEIKTEIKVVRKIKPNDDPDTACRHLNEQNSEFDCKSQCRMDLIQEVCECTPWSLSYLATDEEMPIYPLCDYKKCKASLTKVTASESDCQGFCFQDCTQTRFNLAHEVKGANTNPNLTTIILSWGAFEYWEVRNV